MVYPQQRIEELCILLRLVDFLSCIKANATFTAASQYLPPYCVLRSASTDSSYEKPIHFFSSVCH